MESFSEVNIVSEALSCINNCIQLIATDTDSIDVVVVRLESLQASLLHFTTIESSNWVQRALDILQDLLASSNEQQCNQTTVLGRPKTFINACTIEFLLSHRFTVVAIAKLFGVSRHTIFRRMSENGLSVASTYTQISQLDLEGVIRRILSHYPNTGYKRMKGFLFSEGVRVTDFRVREAMSLVDPAGVYARMLCNRAIVRRQYFVKYFNELWHLDTNMKLIRWKIVIRSCMDRKSSLVTYLDASGDNRSDTNFKSFVEAVAKYGLPSRTRSDKGGENVLIAQFMIDRRGVGRASHICGRSVHNQRIERFWRDVFYGVVSTFYNTFTFLEEFGYLDIDSNKDLLLLHHIFLPRLNESLHSFATAWNNHPLSTENNLSPVQLMLLNMPPPHFDMSLTQADLQDVAFSCDDLIDTAQFEESLIMPTLDPNSLSNEEVDLVNIINPLRTSDSHGCDIFIEAHSLLL